MHLHDLLGDGEPKARAALENERQRKITVRPKKEHPYQFGFNAKIIVITNDSFTSDDR